MKRDVYLIRIRGGCRYRVRHPVRILLLAFSLVSLIRIWHFLREEHASLVYTGGESGAHKGVLAAWIGGQASRERVGIRA